MRVFSFPLLNPFGLEPPTLCVLAPVSAVCLCVCVVCVWDALHKSIGVVAEQEQWEEKKAYSTHCSQVVAHPSTK